LETLLVWAVLLIPADLALRAGKVMKIIAELARLGLMVARQSIRIVLNTQLMVAQ